MGAVARFDCLTLCLIRCSHTHRKCFDFYNMHKVSPWTLLPRGAEQHFRRAIAIDPENGHAHYNLGDLLENHKEDYGSAEQHYRRAIAIDPEHADAHCNLGDLPDRKRTLQWTRCEWVSPRGYMAADEPPPTARR